MYYNKYMRLEYITEHGLVYKVYSDQHGNSWWFRNGKRHREDGHAVEYRSGTKKWYRNGKLHREDGPAIEWRSGYKEWYQNGIKVEHII